MAQYDDRPVYQGGSLQPVRQDVGVMPRDVMAQDRQEGNEQVRRNLAAAEREMIDAHDFYNVTNDEEDIDATYKMAAAELDRRMRLPDDDEDSLIDPTTGQVSQAKLGEFLKPVQERLDIAGRGIVNPEARMRVRARAVEVRNALAGHMAMEAVKLQAERNEFAFEKRFLGAQDREDYGAMLQAVDDAERMRVLSPAQAWEKRRSVQRLMKLKAGTGGPNAAAAVPVKAKNKVSFFD